MEDRTRVISDNDMHVIMSQFLHAANEIHIAMCRFDDDHAAQEFLSNAMQSTLIGAQQCARLHKSEKVRIATPELTNDDEVTTP